MTLRFWESEFLVNQTIAGSQIDPDVTVLSNGQFVVVWEDNSTTDRAIVGRTYNADGTPATDEYVIVTSTDLLYNPDLAPLSDGNFLVSYAESTGSGITHLAVVDTGGNVLSTVSVDASSASSSTSRIAVEVSGNNVWLAFTDDANSNTTRIARYTYDPGTDSLTFSTAFDAPSDVAGSEITPSMAILTGGNVVVAWKTGNLAQFRIFDSAGTAVTADTTISDTGSGNADPDVTALANGGFLVTYALNNSGFPSPSNGDFEVQGRLYSNTGVAYGSAFQINSLTPANQFRPVNVALDDGGFASFWFSNESGGVHGQVFNWDGSYRGGQMTLSDSATRQMDTLDAKALDDGRIVVTWDGYDAGDNNGTGITAVIVDPRDGSIDGDNGSNLIYGNFIDDDIRAHNGNDTVFGRRGDDQISGGDGNDSLDGGKGDDALFGNIDDDTLNGGLGADEMDGGVGTDWATYADSAQAVIVNLGTGNAWGVAGSDARGDFLQNIENVIGSDGDDSLTGSDADNTFIGGLGADTMRGSSGTDTVNYSGSTADVIVNLSTGNAWGGAGSDARGDLVTNIENIFGSAFDDRLTGNGLGNALNGGDGDDDIRGLLGADTIIGGAGIDTARFSDSASGVIVNLGTGVGWGATNSGARGDTYIEMENVIGSDFNDQITGSTGDNSIRTGLGADTVFGGSGVDTVDYQFSESAVIANLTTGVGWGDLNSDARGDELNGLENIIGSDFDDRLTGNGIANTFYTGLGADEVFGSGGIDTVDYSMSVSAVIVNLGTGSAWGELNSDARGDAIQGVENVTGSDFDDRITGSDQQNGIEGGAGDDELRGGLDIDTFIFDTGHDNDTIKDFQDNVDVLQVSSALADGRTAQQIIDQLSLSDGAGGTTIIFGGGDVVTIEGVVGANLVDDIVIV